MLPFTHAEFLNIFAQYNLAIWPGQLLAYVLGVSMLAMVLVTRSKAHGTSSRRRAGLDVGLDGHRIPLESV